MPDNPDIHGGWTTSQLAALARGAGQSLPTTSRAGSVATNSQAVTPVIAGYEILDYIGAGGMGYVWRAHDVAQSTIVAIKVLAPTTAGDVHAVERFEQEIDSLAVLDHPHIVRLLDAGECTDGRLFLATEFIEGCDLGRLLKAEKIPEDHAIGIFLKTCDAVAHAHKCGIIHRDIKPANVLIGADGTVKITDFGLAKLADNSMTTSADALGTPYYVAPEIIRDARSAGVAADIYALGVLLYKLLSGKLPVGNFTPLSQLGFDRRYDPIINQSLADDPMARPHSAAGLAASVTAIRERARARGKLRSAIPWIAGILLLLSGLTLGLWWNERSHRPVPREVFRDPRTATRADPWFNGFGMGFIPVDGTGVLFAVNETRNLEWQKFREVEMSLRPSWRTATTPHGIEHPIKSPMGLTKADKLPGSEEPMHPASGVSWNDAQFFCNWLTIRERNEGRLDNHQFYRLPTDLEWSAAAGAANTAQGEPSAVEGNFAGPEARTADWPPAFPTRGQADPFTGSAPVGSFAPSPSGLNDLAGNILEWVDDVYQANGKSPDENEDSPWRPRTLRGGSWAIGNASEIRPDHRFFARPNRRRSDTGFRVVLDPGWAQGNGGK